MIMKKQVILSAMIVALTVAGVLNLGTIKVSAVESPAIYISPASVTATGCSEIDNNFTFSICSDYNGTDVCGYEFALTYDPSILEGINVTNGDVITEAVNTTNWRPGDWNNITGELELTGNSFFYFTPPPSLVNGTGILANVTFTVVGCGISNITFVESETRLIGYDPEHPRANIEGFYNIIDEYWPDTGHIVGSVFDHSASHDIAVTNVTPNQTVVAQGQILGVNVTVENQGQTAESFTVTAYANTTVIQTKTVTDLANGTFTTLTFTWDTAGDPLGSYTIKANASTVAGETDTADNTKIFGTISVQLPGAVDVTNVTVNRCGILVNGGYKTWTVNVNVTVHNNGSVPIGCTVSVYYYNATVTHQMGPPKNVIDLDPCNTTTLTFSLNLLNTIVGVNYTVKANATCIVGGASDEYVDGFLKKRPWGDINDSGHVSLSDVGKLDLVYSGFSQGPTIDPYCDISGDCKISLSDVGKLDLIYSGFPPAFP